MKRKTKLMMRCLAITVYVLFSTLIGFYITNTVFEIQYKAEVQLLINWYGTTSLACELVIYVPIIMLVGVWIYDSYWKESNIHPGMNIVFHSVILISGINVVTRSVITFDAYNRTLIPKPVIVFVNYFHDTAYFQLPMTPVLMTLERLIATRQFKTYELSQSTAGVTFLVFASWTYAILVNFASVYWPKLGVFFLTAYMHCGLAPGIIILMIYIYRKNLKRYQQINAKTLTERYQTAENIRLLRATFNFTIITISWNVLMFGVSFVLKVQNDPAYALVVTYVWSSWDLLVAIGLFLILTVYLYSVGILQRVYSLLRKKDKPHLKIGIKSVTGIVIPTTAKAEDYFKQLKSAWNS